MIKLKFPLVVLSCLVLLSTSCKRERLAQGTPSTVPAKKDTDFLKQLEFDNYYYEGTKQSMVGNADKAAENFEKALNIDETHAPANYELARAYFSMSRMDEALGHVDQAIKYEPDNKWYYIIKAQILEQQKNFLGAAGVYGKLTGLEPENAEYYNSMANMYLFANQPQKALEVYERMEKQLGVNEIVVLQKHKIYLRQNEVEKAAKEIRKLIDQSPQDLRYYKILADVYQVNGYHEKAFEVLEQMAEIDSTNGKVQMALAEYYRSQRNYERAAYYLKQAFNNPEVDIDQKVEIIYGNYLMQGFTNENKEEAFTLAEMLIEAHPGEAKAHALYGDLLYRDNQKKEARKQYRQSVELQQNVFAVWQQLLFIESELSDWEAMKSESRTAQEYFPNQPILYFFEGVANLQLEDYKEAVSVLETGLSITVGNPNLQGQFHANLAEAYYRQENYKASDEQFEKALDLNPDNAVALNNYAYYLSLRGERLEEAQEMSKRSLSLEPGNASYLDTYGWILYKLGNYAEAKTYIEQALQKSPESAEVLEHYGDVLFQLGETGKAVEQWQKALASGSDSVNLEKKIKEKRLYE
ncbi:MAG: tetratricopeptide repeat protein [Bacteroidia bacterium]